jgi:hypothetical protein
MKKYETWEVFKELSISTNSNLKFKNVISNNTMEIKGGEYVVWNSGSNISLNDFSKWELVQEPVSFMEAVKAFRNDKTIYCIKDECKRIFNGRKQFELKDNNGQYITSAEILNGKWFIEGDN